MKLYTLWITRKPNRDFNPELIAAWDEYSVEGNYEGWEEAKSTALHITNDVDKRREVILSIDDISLARVFKEPEITANIV